MNGGAIAFAMIRPFRTSGPRSGLSLRQIRRPLDPRFRELALSALDLRESGAIAALRLEAYALDLLAGLAGSFRDAHAPSTLSRRDFDRMMAVREVIEGDAAAGSRRLRWPWPTR